MAQDYLRPIQANVALRFHVIHIRQDVLQQKAAMSKCGFIDSFQAADDLSANYKQQAREVLDAKCPPLRKIPMPES